MAEVSVKSSFETLVAVSKMNDSKRQVILRGSCPLLTNPYISYGDRVLLDFRIGLTDEEKDMSLAELNQKFSKLHIVKFPFGQTECLKSQFNGKTFCCSTTMCTTWRRASLFTKSLRRSTSMRSNA